MDTSYRWLLLFAASLILFIINVDYTALNLALLPMASYFHVGLETIQWVLSGYVMTWALFVLPAGRYVDRFGQHQMGLVGLGLFLLASMLAGGATSSQMLIGARLLQGLAGAIYIPAIYALVPLHFTEQERGRAMGMISLGVGIGLAVGPLVGGVWVDRHGLCIPITTGLCVMGIGMGMFTLFSSTTPIAIVCAVFVIIGLGMGCAFTGLNAGVIKTVETQEAGIASSIFIVFALFGNFIGVTVTTGLYENQGVRAVAFLTIGLLLLAAGICFTSMRKAGQPEQALQNKEMFTLEKSEGIVK